MSGKSCRFYFDFISHNAYLAWEGIQPLVQRHQLVLEPVPVLFAGFLKHYGTRGPAEVPPKAIWMIKNVLRKARQADIAIAAPRSHPFMPLPALRAVLAVPEPAAQRQLIGRLFRAVWAEGRAIDSAQALQPLIEDCGLAAQAVLESSQSEKVKTALRENTEAAIAAGVFGVPSLRVDDEVFFGYDDLEFLDAYLNGNDPLDTADLQPWLQVRPSKTRNS